MLQFQCHPFIDRQTPSLRLSLTALPTKCVQRAVRCIVQMREELVGHAEEAVASPLDLGAEHSTGRYRTRAHTALHTPLLTRSAGAKEKEKEC